MYRIIFLIVGPVIFERLQSLYQQLIAQQQHKSTAKTSADLHKAQHEDIKTLQKSTPLKNNISTTEVSHQTENNTTTTVDSNQQSTTKEQSNDKNITATTTITDSPINTNNNNNKTQDSTNSTTINNNNNSQNIVNNQTQQQQQQQKSDLQQQPQQPATSETAYPFLTQQLQQLQQRQLTRSTSQLLSTLSSLYPDYASAIAKAAIANTVPTAYNNIASSQQTSKNPLLDRLIETMKNTQSASLQNPFTASSIRNPLSTTTSSSVVSSSTNTPQEQKVEIGSQLTTTPELSKSLDINNLQPLDLANLISNPGNPVASLVEAAKSYNAMDDITANKKSTQNEKPATGANQVRLIFLGLYLKSIFVDDPIFEIFN